MGYAAREARRGKSGFRDRIFQFSKEIQWGYNGNTRRAKRAAEEICSRDCLLTFVRGCRWDTKENRGARSAPRKIGFWGLIFREYKWITKGIRGARSAPQKIGFWGSYFQEIQMKYKGNTKGIRGATVDLTPSQSGGGQYPGGGWGGNGNAEPLAE